MKLKPLISVLIVFALTSCVVIPTALPDPEPFNKKTLEAIAPGITTKEEIRKLFSSWTYKTDEGTFTLNLIPEELEEGRWWYYSLDREMGAWGICTGHMYVGTCAELAPPERRKYYMLFEFDSADRVAGWWITHEAQRCLLSSVCIRNRYFVIPASSPDDDNAKLFEPKPNQCNVYLYAEDQLINPAEIMLGEGQNNFLFIKEAFIYWSVASGKYELKISDPNWDDEIKTIVECNSGQNLFFDFNQSKEKRILSLVNGKDGISAIKSRYLSSRIISLRDFSAINIEELKNLPIPMYWVN